MIADATGNLLLWKAFSEDVRMACSFPMPEHAVYVEFVHLLSAVEKA
jgi:hypothetical protein